MGVLRAVLVALFAVVTLMLSVDGRHAEATLMSVGLAAHALLWLAMWRTGSAAAAAGRVGR